MVINNNQQNALERPFPAYEGDEPYIFISYAHRDAQFVFPEIKKFHDEGYPVWYDQGLTPGQEWDDEVADALLKSSLLVVFISKNSMASNNVQDEIKLALDEGIDIVPIYLEETKLPAGLRLRLSNKHAIFKHTLNDEDYVIDCFKAFDNAKISKIDNLNVTKTDVDETLKEMPDDTFNNEFPKISKEDLIIDQNFARKHKVYICYDGHDQDIADSVCNILEEYGFKCWLKSRDVGEGYIVDAIRDAVKRCNIVVLIYSMHAMNSRYVNAEIGNAFENNKKIIIFKVDESKIEKDSSLFLLNAPLIDASSNYSSYLYDLVNEIYKQINAHVNNQSFVQKYKMLIILSIILILFTTMMFIIFSR